MTLRSAMLACALLLGACQGGSSTQVPRSALFADAVGHLGTQNVAGPTATSSTPFFQDLGSNGRHCDTCHPPATAWTLTPADLQSRFAASHGTDPVFRPVDGSGCPTQDTRTLGARRSAYALLLKRALIRIELPVPKDAEFTVSHVDNPYGCSDTQAVSVYRRPLPATNLSFLSMVMWDGRESTDGESLADDLAHQSLDATNGHAQAKTPPTLQQQSDIVRFETALYSAQQDVDQAGELGGECEGGPQKLSATPFYPGINDAFGRDPSGAPFNFRVFALYGYWLSDPNPARSAIARGEALFNSRPMSITGVAGLNDVMGQPLIVGTCGTCHDTPNVGNQSLPMPMNIGIATQTADADLPLLTLVNKVTGESVVVSDPGRALISGKWADIGAFKSPTLRGLAARPPYFHDGSAATLADVVSFYDGRFNMQLTAREKADLAAFLAAL